MSLAAPDLIVTERAASDAVPRIATLDLARGVAVLGILAVNIAGLAGPSISAYSPNLPAPGSLADQAVFAGMLVLFEGKMRALFSIVFGASLLLFVERTDEAGDDGEVLQMRRLGWLAVIGYLHFLLLWWGDILFVYAIAGLAALALRLLPSAATVVAALLMFTAWQAEGIHRQLPLAQAEAAVAQGTANLAQRRDLADAQAARAEGEAAEVAALQAGFGARLSGQLADWLYPIELALSALGETLTYMLTGMLLLRSGFFSGAWSAAALRRLAWAGLGLGGGATLAFTAWAWRHGFPEEAMRLAIGHALAFPHLLMALGYLALLQRAAPRVLASALGQRLRAAGRVALSNYVGTSLVMALVFQGWGLGLGLRYGEAALLGFVLLGWVMMLAWSAPWLRHFTLGPLEWLWRTLAERRPIPLKR